MSYLVELGYTAGIAVSTVVMTAVVGYEVDFTAEKGRYEMSGRERMWLTVIISVLVSLLWIYTLPLFLMIAACHRLLILGTTARKRVEARNQAKVDARELARTRMLELSEQLENPIARQSVIDAANSDLLTPAQSKKWGF